MPYKDPEKSKKYRKQYNKAYRENNRQYFRDAYAKWAKDNPDKQKERTNKYRVTEEGKKKAAARATVCRAVKSGRLIRPGDCSSCLTPCKPEADHHDYDKPLDVTWLCKPCHTRITLQRKDATITP